MKDINLFQSLKEEIKRDYGFTKKSIPFIPFEKWRGKLKTYPEDFKDEYSKNLILLKDKLELTNLQKIDNPNKRLILFSGLPGAGKTTLSEIIKKSIPNTILLRGADIVDALHLYKSKVETYRERLRERDFNMPDPWYISYLYQEKLTHDCLNLGYNVVFDDHIRTRENRLGYYNLAKKCNAEIIFIQINAPFETYVKREEGRINKAKLNFLGNFVLQSEDINNEEKNKYSKLIYVDGTSKLKDIEKVLIAKLKSK